MNTINRWTHESKNEWISEWLDDWMNEWVSEWVSDWVTEWKKYRVDHSMKHQWNSNDLVNGWDNEPMNQWNGDWVSQWRSESATQRTNQPMNHCKCALVNECIEWMDGLASYFLCWATSSLSDLFAGAPLLSATSSLSSHFNGLLVLWSASGLPPSYLFCSFCNPILPFAQPAQCVLQHPLQSRIAQ